MVVAVHMGYVDADKSGYSMVVDDGVELSEAIDAFAGGRGIRDAQGAWGVLSRNLITRQDAFRVAVISAFAPFFNREIFSDAERKARA